jgi:hypothetical protein
MNIVLSSRHLAPNRPKIEDIGYRRPVFPLMIFLKNKLRQGMTVTLKVKYVDFKSMTLRTTITKADIMMKYIRPMLDNTEVGNKKVRLLGISISNFVDKSCKMKKYQQLPLPFDAWRGKGSYEQGLY